MAVLNVFDSTIKMLIVEDDGEIRTTLRDTIQMKYPCMEIVCKENGATGLESFYEHAPDVVLSDINMPLMNGIQMVKEIRTINPTVQIVILTAHIDTNYLIDAIRVGINRYIVKPIVYRELFETIDACLAQISLQRQLCSQEEHIRKLSQAVEQSPIVTVITDSNGTIEYTNSRFTTLTGYAQEEVVGNNLFDQMTSAHIPDPQGTLWRSINTGRKWHGELVSQNKNGELFWELVDISHLVNDKGVISHFVVVREDITELRQAREEMLKIQKLESVGVLAGGISHDFNNILTSILGNIFMARTRLDDSEKATFHLQEAEAATDRAKNLTQQLLTFASGGVPIKKIVATGDLLKEAAGFAMRGSKSGLKFDFKDDVWPVEADEGQLTQVMHNLITNAVQAMPEGGVITIRADNVISSTVGKRFVRIAVIDTGTGISEQDLPKIFDPYFSTKEHGSGLGLASCHSIIRKHGGKIRAASTLGKGSTFKISLPASNKILVTEPSRQVEVFPGNGKILVMDDEKIIREVVMTMLEYFGYEVECVENGIEALQLFQKRKEQGTPFTAVILDLTIPGGMGGKETIEKLLKIDSSIKAVVSSGYSSDPVMANFRDYGFSAVLKKPYLPQDLSKVLNELNIEEGRLEG